LNEAGLNCLADLQSILVLVNSRDRGTIKLKKQKFEENHTFDSCLTSQLVERENLLIRRSIPAVQSVRTHRIAVMGNQHMNTLSRRNAS
jgi:hypothetical protein